MKHLIILSTIFCFLGSACRPVPVPIPDQPIDPVVADTTWPSMLMVNADTFRYDTSDFNEGPVNSGMVFYGNPQFFIHFEQTGIPLNASVPLNAYSTPGYCSISMIYSTIIYGIPIPDHSSSIRCDTYGVRKKQHLSLDSILFVNRVDTGGPLLIDGTDSLWISGDFYQ